MKNYAGEETGFTTTDGKKPKHERVSVNTLVMCEGDCEEHTGEVRRVRVKDTQANLDWGFFNYCENARREDERRGFWVLST